MSNQRAAEYLRQAAAALSSGQTDASEPAAPCPPPEIRGSGGLVPHPGISGLVPRPGPSGLVARSGPSGLNRTAPSKEDKVELLRAGLGEKKIQLRKNSSPESFKATILQYFPRLTEGGGFELLRTITGSRHLSKLWVPSGGFTSAHLADESGVGQALIYIRPIQRDLELDKLVIEKASSQEEYEKVIEDHSDYFEQASFHKKLGPETAASAVSIIKEHYMFYRCLGSIRQFMEGLNLHGILSLMREFSNEARLLMNAGSSISAEDIKKYYETSFSESGTKEREIEEKVIFNFHRFLSRAEKGRVLCKVVILDGDRAIEESRQTTLADILQAFVGSPALPMNINSGLLIFEHKTKIGMSLINTCAPSITFQRTSTLVDYQNFEDTIMNMVYGCIGFGQA